MAMDLDSFRSQGGAFLVCGLTILAVAILNFFFTVTIALAIVGIVFTLLGVALVNRQQQRDGDGAP